MEMEPEELMGPEEFYDNMAPYYDKFIESTRYNILSLEEEEKFINSFIKDKRTILDLGCGTGRTMKLLSSVRRELVGVDISRKMIEIAGNDGLNVVQASALNLPFNNNCFDGIYSIHGGFGYCRNNDEVNSLSTELFRVLSQEGLILIDTPHGMVRGPKYMISWPAGNRIIHAIGYGKNKDEILKALNRAGFRQIRFFGTYGGYAKLKDDSRRIIVCATKGIGLPE